MAMQLLRRLLLTMIMVKIMLPMQMKMLLVTSVKEKLNVDNDSLSE
jgi:hypothetical protein